MPTTEKHKVIVSAQVKRDVRDELARRALESDRSLSGEIRRALFEYLERDPEKETQ
jgi:hypothetical protein